MKTTIFALMVSCSAIPSWSADDAQPTTLEVPYCATCYKSAGTFRLESIRWTQDDDPTKSGFSATAINKTGLKWKYATLRLTAHGDGEKSWLFDVDVLFAGEDEVYLNGNPFPSTFWPVRSITGQFTEGAILHPVWMVATAKDCIPDFIAAGNLSGLALRKKLAELETFGCVKAVAGEILRTEESATFPSGPNKRVKFSHVVVSARDTDHRSTEIEGWIRSPATPNDTQEEVIKVPH